MQELSGAEARAMRAIVAREKRRAAAERREAQQAFAAARAATPSSSAWDRKPESQKAGRARRGAARELADRQDLSRHAWAERHPALAKAERALRKERAVLLDRWKHKGAGTPETHERAARRNQGALARLCENGTISADQLAAAEEIAQTAERIGADVSVRTASLETRIDAGRRGDGTFYERLAQVRLEVAYTRWRSEVRGPIAAVLDMIVGFGDGGAIGFTVAAKRYRMHNRRAKQLLVDALDLWLRIRGRVSREVDDATLAAAHAGLL